MQVYIAGSGKLATELLGGLKAQQGASIAPWGGVGDPQARSIVVHAGSGRELDRISAFCANTSSVLVELATGSSLEDAQPAFPVVLCPNTNILMLKFMCMLARSGALFKGSDIRITESHQSGKTSVPGTAVQMALSLGLMASEIHSVRDPSQQGHDLGIPPEHLARHAFHRIDIQDGPCTITMETRVYGDSPYVSGVQQIVGAVQCRALQPRVYSLQEFIDKGWV